MTAEAQTDNEARRYHKTLRGVVTSAKADKTITIEVTRTIRHKRYNKYVKRRAKYAAHDEKNVAEEGDTVDIVEARPMSKRKRWRLVNVVEKHRN